jgi:hypothetical protein
MMLQLCYFHLILEYIRNILNNSEPAPDKFKNKLQWSKSTDHLTLRKAMRSYEQLVFHGSNVLERAN